MRKREPMDILDGIRIVSFNHFLMGPVGIQLLADLGGDDPGGAEGGAAGDQPGVFGHDFADHYGVPVDRLSNPAGGRRVLRCLLAAGSRCWPGRDGHLYAGPGLRGDAGG